MVNITKLFNQKHADPAVLQTNLLLCATAFVCHKDLPAAERFLDSFTPHREVFTQPQYQIVSPHWLNQPAWTLPLVRKVVILVEICQEARLHRMPPQALLGKCA